MQTRKNCSLQNCESKHYGHGFCSKHYRRWKKGDDLYRLASKRSIADPRYFWRKVKKVESGCWEWQGGLTKSGYGSATATVEGVSYQRAHRLAYFFATAQHPAQQFVLHTCDNRQCVNPDHLFLGSHADNMADMSAKGRRAVGEAAGHNLLTTEAVIQIKTQLRRGQMQKEIASTFGVSRSTVNAIAKGRLWSHLEVNA